MSKGFAVGNPPKEPTFTRSKDLEATGPVAMFILVDFSGWEASSSSFFDQVVGEAAERALTELGLEVPLFMAHVL